MKTYTITVNGNVYHVTVEEGTSAGAPVAPAPVSGSHACGSSGACACSSSSGSGSSSGPGPGSRACAFRCGRLRRDYRFCSRQDLQD